MGARILVVDDEANHRATLAIGLRLEGFEVAEAVDGREGVAVVAREPVDLAIVDLMMPGMNGLAFARHLRAHAPGVKVVLTSAYHLSEGQLARADAGILSFVPKPYAIDALIAYLKRQLPVSAPSPDPRLP